MFTHLRAQAQNKQNCLIKAETKKGQKLIKTAAAQASLIHKLHSTHV